MRRLVTLLRALLGRPERTDQAAVDARLQQQRRELARLRAVEARVRAIQARR